MEQTSPYYPSDLVEFLATHASIILDINPEYETDTDDGLQEKREVNDIAAARFLEEFTSRILPTRERVVLAVFSTGDFI